MPKPASRRAKRSGHDAPPFVDADAMPDYDPCVACQTVLDYASPYRDDEGRVLCAGCFWRAYSA